MTDYALTYFGKPLADIEYVDVERFFNKEHSESDQIEFKSFNSNGPLDSKLPGIIEGITAFLNSSGGLLIWGAPEGVKIAGKKEKVFTGSLTKLPITIEKDWLISKIADKIIPLPRGFRVQLAACADGQVAVFEIDESPYSPHQTDNRYYMRIDGQNKPAPHHYIEALFKKISFPKLEVYLGQGKTHPVTRAIHAVEVSFIFLNLSHYLNEEKLSFRIEIDCGYFADLEPSPEASLPLPSYHKDRRQCRNPVELDISLPYATPFVLAEELHFREAELKKHNDRAAITIFFSGKTAPPKFCRYYLKFSSDRKQVTFNIGEQNRLLSDMEKDHGLIIEKLRTNDRILQPKPSDKTWFLED
jgi:hypothetical protein